jgi:hypothetical protein
MGSNPKLSRETVPLTRSASGILFNENTVILLDQQSCIPFAKPKQFRYTAPVLYMKEFLDYITNSVEKFTIKYHKQYALKKF